MGMSRLDRTRLCRVIFGVLGRLGGCTGKVNRYIPGLYPDGKGKMDYSVDSCMQ